MARKHFEVLRDARRGFHRARFALWVLGLRLTLRWRGGRLELEAPHGAKLVGFPTLNVFPRGDGDGVFHVRIEQDVVIGRGVRLTVDARGTNFLHIGERARIQDGVRLWLHSGSIRVGGGTYLRDQAVLKSSGDLRIGEGGRVGSCTVVHCHERIDIADRVGIADLIMIVDSDHTLDGSDAWYLETPVRSTPIQVKTNTLISTHAVITRGAVLGPNSVVAAGAVVRAGEYPAGWLIGGVPAQPLRPLADDHPES